MTMTSSLVYDVIRGQVGSIASNKKININFFPSTNLIYLTVFLKSNILNIFFCFWDNQDRIGLSKDFECLFNDRSWYIFLAELLFKKLIVKIFYKLSRSLIDIHIVKRLSSSVNFRDHHREKIKKYSL